MISLTAPVEIWAHRISAGIKLSLLCLVTAGLFALHDPVALLVALLAIAGLVSTGGPVFLRSVIVSLSVLLPFLALLAAWHLLAGDVREGLVVAFRLICALALANFVAYGARVPEVCGVLHGCGKSGGRDGPDTGH